LPRRGYIDLELNKPVARTALVERLATTQAPVITVTAPPGYGKTTLMAQWAGRPGSRVAWLSCDDADNDPVVLLSALAIALGRIGPVDAARAAGPSALTAAELRLLPLLSTHLPVPEIAAELFLSPHTVKSELKSIYRKLGATTRTQAVTRSRELGLLGL